jgi:hypothetical protein
LALSVPSGTTAVASSIGADALAQASTPEAVRGRVLGSLQAFIWLMSLLGAVVGGLAGQLVGVLPAVDLASLVVALSGATTLLLLPARTADRPGIPHRRD